MSLREALLDALKPHSLRERLRLRITKGRTSIQLLERLPLELQYALQEGPDNLTVAKRQAIHAVNHGLYSLIQEGLVVRQDVDLHMNLPGKGMRGIRVDVFRLL